MVLAPANRKMEIEMTAISSSECQTFIVGDFIETIVEPIHQVTLADALSAARLLVDSEISDPTLTCIGEP